MKLNVEYLKYEIKPRYEENFPLDWEKFFRRRGKLFVEIGFGNGEFLVEMARRYPEKNFVGFELSITSMVKVQRKIHDFKLENVRVVMEDGRFALREFFGDESVETVVTNFPCPWPKKAHKERRIT
ncbi:MAG: tRNA (guanosine(46)-N7)-methyltransferase TrmB, partial [Thermotoga sp.]